MRLNQYIAKYQSISRRHADELISDAKVFVNDVPAVLGQQIDETKDVVVIQKYKDPSKGSVEIQPETFQKQTVLFYKPIFCLTTRFDPQKRKIIYDFLPKQFFGLKPAGRLDYMSEGLLILSNDGELINQLTHPKNEHTKSYLVGVNQKLSSEFLKIAKSGSMEIDEYQLNEVQIEPLDKTEHLTYSYLKLNHDLHWYKFILSEGRNNQIRKMVEAFDMRVQRLIRIQQGEYELTKELFESKYRIMEGKNS
jgi:23S rRNA pseudouridine2605 synthase